MFVTFYYLLLLCSTPVGKTNIKKLNEETNLYLEATCLRSQIFAKLDPFLRIQLQKRGITVIQNTYVGFDTEYEVEDPRNFLNKLVSVQLAVQCRTLVKVPLYTVQDIIYIHPLTNEISAFYKPSDYLSEDPEANSVKNALN